MDLSTIDPAKWADAILLLIGGLLGLKGYQRIKKGNDAPPADVMEVAGAIISSKDVDRIVASLDAFTASAAMMKGSIDRDVAAKEGLTKALVAFLAAMDRNSDVLKDNTISANAVATQAHDLEQVISYLAKELEMQSRMQARSERGGS